MAVKQRRSTAFRVLAVAIMLGAGSSAMAAADSYDIEIIVFKNLEAAALDYEVWPEMNPDPVYPVNAVRLGAPAENGVTPEQTWQRLPRDMYQLKDIWGYLRRSAQFKPMIHLSWRQPALERNQALPVIISSRPETPEDEQAPETITTVESISEAPAGPVIDGTIEVSVSRYLHVHADLTLREYPDIPTYQAPESPQPALLGALGRWVDSDAPAPVDVATIEAYRLDQHRRMRSGKLHYLDNPRLGLLVQITPVEAKAEPE